MQRIHELGAKAGVALNPGTPLETLREVLGDLDLILVMSVNPGFGGQAYIPASTDKIRKARVLLDELGSRAELEVDGGVDASNVAVVAAAGISVAVAGSAVFRHPGGVGAGIAALRGALDA